MRKSTRYQMVLDWFRTNHPLAETELHYRNPFELLVAVILSAQCTDKRVNIVTPALFQAFPTPALMARATADEIFPYIRTISYPNNKAKHLVATAQMMVNDFDGQVPETFESLIKMPGVGRKTANVIQSVIFNKAAMAVDTHVFRVSRRLGLVSERSHTPYSVEKELTSHISAEDIPIAHHWLILHGRYVCMARNPLCDKCGLQIACKYYEQLHKVSDTPGKESNNSHKIRAKKK